MKKDFDTINDGDDIQPQYDYWSSELINAALRQLIAEGRAPEPRDE